MQGTLRAPVSTAKRRDDYVVVGHVTRDVIPATGAEQVGGTAFYSGLEAARLGLRTRIVTAGDPDEIARLLAPYAAELEVEVQPAAATTSFEARGVGAARRLRILSWAGPIEPPEGGLDAAIVHVAPVARETERLTDALGETGFLGLTPQGLIRRWDEHGAVIQVPLDPATLPGRCDALVISEAERRECAAALEVAVTRGAVVSVTAGAGGAEVLAPGGSERAAPPRVVSPRDDLGAGDVYAAAFFVALAAGAAPGDAMRRGQEAALRRLVGEWR